MKNSIIITLMMAFLAIVLISFTPLQEKKKGGPWQIPAEYKAKKNPHADDEALVRLGRAGYGRHCRSCHGRTGLGDGPMAAQLETDAGDLSDATWQAKFNDGELYYMSFIGRDEMPNFEDKITDEEERWAIINFIRSLK